MNIFQNLLSSVTRALTTSMTFFTRRLQMVQSLWRKPVTWASNFVKELIVKLFRKPSSRKDYVKIGRRLVSIRLLFFVAVGLIVGSYLFLQFVLPWCEGRLWTVDVYINSEKYKTVSGNVRVHDVADNLIYEGNMESGKMKGYGVQYNSSGELVYKGEFNDSKYSGNGEKYEDGELVYQGNFAENLYDGDGMSYAPGQVLEYAGSFSKGEKSGTGTEYDLETGNKIYCGNFDVGVRSGNGRAFLNDGMTLIYEGSFAEDAYGGGSGTLYQDGRVLYKGEFSKGVYSGEGTLYDLDSGNTLYVGSFADGKYNGDGTLYNVKYNVKQYTGHFSKGKKDGDGESFDILGTSSFKGSFKNDEIDYVSYMGQTEDKIVEAFKNPSYKETTTDYEYMVYSNLGVCFILDAQIDEKTGEVQLDKQGNKVYQTSRAILSMKSSPYGIKEDSTKKEIEEKFSTTSFSSTQFTFTDMYRYAFSKLSSSLAGATDAPSVKYLPGDSGNYFIRLYYSADSTKIVNIEIASATANTYKEKSDS